MSDLTMRTVAAWRSCTDATAHRTPHGGRKQTCWVESTGVNWPAFGVAVNGNDVADELHVVAGAKNPEMR